MLLVFHGAGSDGDVGQEILYIGQIFRVQHLISGGHAGLLDGAGVELAHMDKTLQHILALGGVGLVYHALVALAGGPGLVGVYSRNDDYLVLDLLLKPGKAAGVVHHGILVIRRARPDYQQELVGLPGEHVRYHSVAPGLYRLDFIAQRVKLLYLLRNRELSAEIH